MFIVGWNYSSLFFVHSAKFHAQYIHLRIDEGKLKRLTKIKNTLKKSECLIPLSNNSIYFKKFYCAFSHKSPSLCFSVNLLMHSTIDFAFS